MSRQDEIRAEAESKRAEMMAAAMPADEDTESRLTLLHKMVLARREDPELKIRYEALRDALASQIKTEGPRYFINNQGVKQYAYVVAGETVESSVEELTALFEAGEISKELYERLCPRGIDKEQLRQAIARGANPRSRSEGLKPEHVAKVCKIVAYGTPYVAFADAQEDPE